MGFEESLYLIKGNAEELNAFILGPFPGFYP